MQIEFTPQIPNLIPPDKAKCTQNTCAGFLAQLSAPFPTTHNHIHCTSVSRCLRFRLKAIKRGTSYLEVFRALSHLWERQIYVGFVINTATDYFFTHSPCAGVPQVLFTSCSDNQQ